VGREGKETGPLRDQKDRVIVDQHGIGYIGTKRKGEEKEKKTSAERRITIAQAVIGRGLPKKSDSAGF